MEIRKTEQLNKRERIERAILENPDLQTWALVKRFNCSDWLINTIRRKLGVPNPRKVSGCNL